LLLTSRCPPFLLLINEQDFLHCRGSDASWTGTRFTAADRNLSPTARGDRAAANRWLDRSILSKIKSIKTARKIDSAGFSARGRFKRSDFGMKTHLGAIGDDIDLITEIEAKKKS
jgi:hypothetical protein